MANTICSELAYIHNWLPHTCTWSPLLTLVLLVGGALWLFHGATRYSWPSFWFGALCLATAYSWAIPLAVAIVWMQINRDYYGGCRL